MDLIVGLGNPGPAYARNRHNVGFMFVDRLAEESNGRFEFSDPLSLTCRIDCQGHPALLAKPQTFMNLSGRAVRRMVDEHALSLSNLLVVYDDLTLPLGTLRIRRMGRSGGHKGMESIIEAFSTEEVPRLRIGIGTGEAPVDYTPYVLGDFSDRELEILQEVFDRACGAVETILCQGLERAMALYN